MRKVQDHYFQRARQEGYPARSVYKLQEAQEKYRLLRPAQRVLDLGCHPGSWSLYAASMLGPAGLVVGVDLQRGAPGGRKGHAEIVRFCYDVFDEGLAGELLSRWAGFHVLLSDMAPRTTGMPDADHLRSVELVRRVLELTPRLLLPGGNLYCKVFAGGEVEALRRETRAMFQRFRVVKPKSSRDESREEFLLGQGFLPGAGRGAQGPGGSARE